MHKKFKLLFFLLFILSVNIISLENKTVISFIKQKTNSQSVIINYLVDLAETYIEGKYKNYIFKNLMGDIESYDLKEIQKVVNDNGVMLFFLITPDIKDNLTLNIRLYDSQSKIYFDKDFKIESSKNIKLTQEKENEWLNLIESSLIINLDVNKRKPIEKIKSKTTYKYDHDFPLISFTLTALSAKIYFDSRINSKIQKIFSLSPIDLRLSFYPLRYMETGMFCRFDFNNMVFNYYDKNDGKNKYFDSNLLINYGLFFGASFFKENIHFSFGMQISNLYYDVNSFSEFKKTNDINSYFLPQFAIYYKMDFKLLKYLYFSIFLNFKSLPKFELNNDYLYSKPFYYDFFCLEFTFAGLSIMF